MYNNENESRIFMEKGYFKRFTPPNLIDFLQEFGLNFIVLLNPFDAKSFFFNQKISCKSFLFIS